MFDDSPVENIIHAGLIFGVYMFITIVLFLVISSPVDLILGGIQTASANTAASDEMTWLMPNILWAVKVVFALSFAIPIVWFIFWVLSREPDIGLIRRY